jgi:hypothetical protein
MGGACGTHGGIRNGHKIWVRKYKIRINTENLGVFWEIILKCIFKNNVRVWTGIM